MAQRDTEDELAARTPDAVATVAKAVAGMAPIVGPLLAELVGTIIPGQRIGRVAEFCVELDARISKLEQVTLESRLEDPEFCSLLEEGLLQSARVVSSKRRTQIAELIAHSLTPGEIEYAESEHLLQALRELNDVEVIRLGSYLHPSLGPNEYRDRHREELAPALVGLASPQPERDKAALQQSYDNHLERLGLLRIRYAVDSRTKMPQFDPRTGAQKVRGYGLTPFGQLLLRQIGVE